MFYRYTRSGLRVPVDLDGLYSGSCFIAGGSPSLLLENLSLLDQPGINVLAMNNTASVVPCNLWIGGDKPVCYSPRITTDPRITKFAVISRKDQQINEVAWKHYPNMYFFGTHEKFTVGNLLKPDRDFVWWKNTFYMALQLAWRLGFRTVYLTGCQFKMDKDKHYSYDTVLTDKQIAWNNRTYERAADNMKYLKAHFDKVGFKVISATPDSRLNEWYPTIDFRDAVQEALMGFPREWEIGKCPHSSELGEKDNTAL